MRRMPPPSPRQGGDSWHPRGGAANAVSASPSGAESGTKVSPVFKVALPCPILPRSGGYFHSRQTFAAVSLELGRYCCPGQTGSAETRQPHACGSAAYLSGRRALAEAALRGGRQRRPAHRRCLTPGAPSTSFTRKGRFVIITRCVSCSGVTRVFQALPLCK